MKRIFILIIVVASIIGCCPTEKVCPTPIEINCEYKTWPIETSPALRPVTARKLDDPDIVAGLTREDLTNLGINITNLFIWGSKNQNTLMEINKQVKTKQ